MDNWEQFAATLIDSATRFGLRAIGALVLLLVAWIVAGMLGRLVSGSLIRAKLDAIVAAYIGKLVHWLIVLLAVLGSLAIFGVDTTAFAAVIGAAGLAIGLAFQGTLGNFAAGIMLLAFRPYKAGDVIEVAGELGKAITIDLFSTSVDTFDNRRLTIPNGAIFGTTIENYTYHPHRRAEVKVGVSYDADIDQTREVLERALQGVPDRLDDPAPSVSLMELGASSVDWTLWIWATHDNWWAVRQATVRAVKLALDEAGLGIPYPQMDVHLDGPGE